jgi:hypothetical protein
MNFEDIKIIIPTCDKYIHIVEGLVYTLEKHFNVDNKFIILGYSEPNFELPKNYEFISLGVDKGPNNWSNDLISFFKNFKDKFFINMIDDSLMTRDANIEKIKKALKYMIKNPNVKKIFLHGSLTPMSTSKMLGDTRLTPISELNNEFLDVNQESNYRTSLQSAIWDRDYFVNMLKPNLSPWTFETQHIKRDGARILTTLNDHPIMFSHVYIKGDLNPEWYKSVYESSDIDNDSFQKIKNIIKWN